MKKAIIVALSILMISILCFSAQTTKSTTSKSKKTTNKPTLAGKWRCEESGLVNEIVMKDGSFDAWCEGTRVWEDIKYVGTEYEGCCLYRGRQVEQTIDRLYIAPFEIQIAMNAEGTRFIISFFISESPFNSPPLMYRFVKILSTVPSLSDSITLKIKRLKDKHNDSSIEYQETI